MSEEKNSHKTNLLLHKIERDANNPNKSDETVGEKAVDGNKKNVSKKLLYRPRRIFQKIVAVFIVAFAVFVSLASYHVVSSGNALFTGINNSSFFTELIGFIQSGDKKIVGEKDDRINVLLIGVGGEGHEGGMLADTIILANIKPSTNEIVLLSIPRDMVVNIPGYGMRKINSANAYGEMDNLPGGGGMFMARILSNTLNTPIPYYIRIDFSGFKKIVDDLKNIDINVDNTFADYEYPTTNFGYQTISFKKGLQKMDGDKSLKYVRSRHGNNGEGSDFARSRRQQKVIIAIKDKMLSLGFLANPDATGKTAEDLGNHVKTNLKLWEMMRLRSYAEKINSGSVASKVLDNTEAGMLKDETGIDGAYLLAPREKDFSEIQNFVKNIFDYQSVFGEKTRLDLFAPFSDNKEIDKVKHALVPWGIEVIIRNEKISGLPTTLPILSVLSGDQKIHSLTKIQELFPKTFTLPATVELPNHPKQNNNINYSQPSPDVVVIMDKNL